MTVKQFVTSERRLTITVNKNSNGSYSSYENRTREEGGAILILTSFSLSWLIESLHMYYLPEKLETIF